jgi:ferritin-like protein
MYFNWRGSKTIERKVLVMSKEVRKMESMAKMEEDYSTDLSASIKGVTNVVIRELLKSVALDSQKHAGFYTGIASLLKGESKALTEDEYDTLEEALKKHIQTESKMIREVKQILRTEKDSRATTLLKEIYADETRHHALMRNLLVAVITKETIFDEDAWNILWKDVPTHGAPPEFMQP